MENTKILFIAPLPPPITGQSLAVEIIKQNLEKKYEIEVINLVKGSLKNGINSVNRVLEIFRILKMVALKQKNSDIIYFTISESFAGNLKDLMIYSLCYSQLNNMIIHLHGGAGMRKIMEGTGAFSRLNKFFIKKVKKTIILGESHKDIFAFLDQRKIKIVKNFAEDYLYIDESHCQQKFNSFEIIEVLFLSNLISGKGHKEIVEAFLLLEDSCKKKLKIKFAGGFESMKEKEKFLNSIYSEPQLSYIGLVSGQEKKQILNNAHVFCLPTYYAYEGQPISILEAYASGCAVVTTNHSGIRDVFGNNFNGYEVEKKSISSLKETFELIINRKTELLKFASTNRLQYKKKYTEQIYNDTLTKVICSG
jgi:glycosyltransferase involved in cell wall biosynthesis